MTRFLTLAALGVASIGLTLATPATSQAQSRYGVHIDLGRTHIDFGNRGHYHGSGYYPGYSQYHQYRPSYGHSHYDPYSYRRPIVVPEYYHWTPGRGYHSHGEILIPHRGHYHVRPY